MSRTTAARPRRMLSALLAAAVAFGGALLVPNVAQAADSGTVSNATLEWGIKDSFRKYIAMPFTHGGSEAIGSVTMPADPSAAGSTFGWSAGTGTANADGSVADVQFAGGVRMFAHNINGVYALDTEFTNPRIEVTSPTTGNLYLDTKYRKFAGMTAASTEVVTEQGVLFATLSFAAPAVTDGVASFTNVDATLTAAGSAGFAGFYPEGTKLEGTFNFSLPITVTPDPVATSTSVLLRQTSFEEGAAVDIAAKVVPAEATAGSVEFFADGKSLGQGRYIERAGMWVLSASGLAVGEHAITAVFTPTDAQAFTASTSAAQNITVTAKPVEQPTPTPVEPEKTWTPKIEVFLADGVTPVADTPVKAGDTIVIKGSGFDPQANVGGRGMPIPSDLAQGSYVVFGQFAQAWQPSSGAASSARPVESQTWALTDATYNGIPAMFKGAISAQRTVLNEDGTFTWELTLPEIAKGVEGGVPGIYSYPGGGIKNAAYELTVPLNYVTAPDTEEPTPVEPETPAQPETPVAAELSAWVNDAASATVTEGTEVTLKAGPFAAGEEVEITVHSNPVTVGTYRADAQGYVTTNWLVPTNFAGAHTVFFTAKNSGKQVTAKLNVTAAAPAANVTGTQIKQQLQTIQSAVSKEIAPVPSQPATAGQGTLAQTGATEPFGFAVLGALLLVAGAAVARSRKGQNA